MKGISDTYHVSILIIKLLLGRQCGIRVRVFLND